jgi:hypothetical protein
VGSCGDGLTVLGLRVENVKRCKLVHLTPRAAGVTKIKGRNRQGKSSTIDSLVMAIGGKAAIPSMPIRTGAESGEIEVSLGNALGEKYIVKESITSKGSYLTVKARMDGRLLQMTSPQGFLDDIQGSGIGFDPARFCQEKAAAQVKMVLDVMQLPEDPRELATQRKALYTERTGVNRQVAQALAILEASRKAPLPEAPDVETSMADLVSEFNARTATIKAHAGTRASHGKLVRDWMATLERDETRYKAAEDAMEAARMALQRAEAEYAHAMETLSAHQQTSAEAIASSQATIDALIDPDAQEIQDRLRTVEAENARVRARQAAMEKLAQIERNHAALADSSDQLTWQIESLDTRTAEILAQATWPVAGLGIAEDGGFLTFNGVPLDQCSDSEKIQIGMDVCMATNPTIKLVLIRQGSLMDEEALAHVERLALERGYQVLVEIVGTGQEENAFVIEDGEVVEQA